MADVNDPRNVDQDAFVVAVNGQGQYALWQAALDLPAGWRRQSAAMPRVACLHAIAGAWQDIAPASVRAAASGQRRPAESARGEAMRGDQRGHPAQHRHDARFAHERFAEQGPAGPARPR